MGNVTWQNWNQFGQPTLEVTSTTTRKATTNLGLRRHLGLRPRRPLAVPAGVVVVARLLPTTPRR